MKARSTIICAILALVLLGLLIGCSSAPTPTSQPAAPAPAQTSAAPKPITPAATTAPPAAAPAAKTIELSFGAWGTPTSAMAVGLVWYLDEVEKRSNGAVKFKRYWNESMVKADALLDALDTGIADTAMVNPTYTPGKVPLATVSSLPFFATEDVYPAYTAFLDLYEQMPVMSQELGKLHTKQLALFGGATGYLWTSKPVKTLADLKGMKIRSMGEQAVLMQSLGAVPVPTLTAEMYDALAKKTIDGLEWPPSVIPGFSLQEVCKYGFLMPTGGRIFTLGIRQDAWAKIPADLQKMMTDLAREHVVKYRQIYQEDGNADAYKKMAAAGVTIAKPTAAELDQVKALCKEKIINNWIQSMASKGLPGKEVWDKYASLIDKYDKANPYVKK